MWVKQVLSLPGPEYSQSYLQQLVRDLTSYIEQSSNPGGSVCATLRVLQMPHSGYNLPVGSVWSNNGVLYVVELNIGYAGCVLGTTGLGTVTVVTHP